MSKKIIKILAGLVILGALAIGLIIWNINPIVEGFRPKLASLISDTIRQPVEIGSIKLRLFPTQAVELGDISLAGGKDGGAKVGRALLVVDLMALFKKRLEVSEVSVDGLNITATREADGTLKVGGVPMQKKEPAQAPPSEQQKADTSSIQFHTKTVRLTGGRIALEDKMVSPPQTIELGDLRVSVDNITQEAVEKFEIVATLLGKAKENLKLSGSVKGLKSLPLGVEPTIDFAFKKIDLQRLEQLAAAYGKKVDKLSMKDTLDIEVGVRGTAAAPRVQLKLDGKPATIAFGELFEKTAGSALQVVTALQHEAPKVDISTLEITLGKSVISLPATLNTSTKAGKISVKSKSIELSDLASFLPMLRQFGLAGNLSLDLSADIPPGGPKGSLSANGAVELKDIGATVTLPAAEGAQKPEPLTVKEVNGKIELQGDTISMKGLKLNVAGQPLEVGVKAAGLPDPALQYALRAPRIGLGPLLKAVKPGGVEAANASSIDGLEVRGGFDKKSRAGNVAVTFEKGDLANLPVGAFKLNADFSLDAANKPLKAVLQPSNLAIFGGTASFQGSLSPDKQIAFQLKAGKIDIKRALDVVRPDARISMSGTLESLSTQVTARQPNVGETLAGPAALQVTNGAVEGFNIVGQALAKVDKIPGVSQALLAFIPEKYAPLFKANRTAFDRLTVDAILNGGNTTLNSFKIIHAAYEISGEGALPKSGEIEIRAQLTLTAEIANGMIAKEPKLKLLQDSNGGIVFPIAILKRDGIPIVIPDISKLAKNALRNTAKEAATRALDKGLEKVAPGLGGALDSLFK